MSKNLIRAFPNPGGESGFTGMTLRDWFAGQALTNLAGRTESAKEKALYAYKVADAMMEAREQE